MKYYFINSLFVGASLLAINGVAQENEWELKKDKAGITVHTRSVENTNINEFRAYTKISSSSATISNIILDVENYTKWIEDVSYSEKVYQEENRIGMYYQIGLPWPIQDRDITLISVFETLPDSSILFHLSSSPSIKEDDEDFIRIKEISGYWLIKPIDKENCEVTYQFLADPEGSLPAWVINLFIVDGPFKTMQNLDKYAKTIINQE